MLLWRPRVAAALAVTFAVSACGQEGAKTNVAPVTAPDAGGAPAASPAAASAVTSLWNGGQAKPLDIQVAHPNGVVLQLTSLQSRPTETVVGVRIINGRDREVELNRFNNRRDGYLVVDSGERIYLSPPAANPRLSIQAGQTLEGELVFLGRLPQGQSAILVLNENSSTDNQHTTQPGFRIDLPLQGASQ
ncbi:MAG: hypothetical protein U1C74_05085 [Phenylobacterium sp.]|nr:hypothetical protein [Phenylobacterium sp.]